MRHHIRLMWVMVVVLSFGWSLASATERLDVPTEFLIGTVHVAGGESEPDAFVFLVSDAGGWTDELDAAADDLGRKGFAVAGIDLAAWSTRLATGRGDTDCYYAVGDLESAAKFIQRSWNLRQYHHPIVAGLGEGGTLAGAALANAPRGTILGAVTVDPARALHTPVPLCPPDVASAAEGGGFVYPDPTRQEGWSVNVQWRGPSPGYEPGHADMTSIVVSSGQHLTDVLFDAIHTGIAQSPAPADVEASLSDLPLVELPVGRPADTFAIVLSGDGGWRDLDASIATVFMNRGLPTIGLDSLRYFWTKRTPQEVAADLDRIVLHYRRLWGADHVAIVGFSFGADVLPAVWPRLSVETKQAVVQVSLLSLGVTAEFEFHVSGWMGWHEDDSRPIPPDLAHMDRSRVQCFFGADEDLDSTGCRSLEAVGAELVERPGGHHFDGDYAAIAETILVGLKRRGGGTW